MSNENSERDMHFQNAAKLLMCKVDEKNREKAQSTGHYLDEDELRLLVAQFAYDLAVHVTNHVAATMMDSEQVLRFTPDLAAWPNSSAD